MFTGEHCSQNFIAKGNLQHASRQLILVKVLTVDIVVKGSPLVRSYYNIYSLIKVLEEHPCKTSGTSYSQIDNLPKPRRSVHLGEKFTGEHCNKNFHPRKVFLCKVGSYSWYLPSITCPLLKLVPTILADKAVSFPRFILFFACLVLG